MNMHRATLFVCAITFSFACGTNSSAPDPDASAELPASCTAIDASVCTTPTPSFTNDIQPMLNRACNSTCHAPGVGPWPLVDYDDVHDWVSIIQADIVKCSMPPPDAGAAGNGPLSDAERTMLLDWIACGAPPNPYISPTVDPHAPSAIVQ
jgi:hypothetical protein